MEQQDQKPIKKEGGGEENVKKEEKKETKTTKKNTQLTTDYFSDDIIYSKEVQEAISKVVPAADPLDEADFDPVAYINNAFPDEASLDNLDEVIKRMSIKVRRLDNEIVSSVRAQMDSSASGKQELEAAQSSIKELAVKIQDIKEKAEASGKLVNEICKDIKSLDYAKTNLTVSINALMKLQTLSSGVSQLKSMLSNGKYSEAGNKLQAIVQLTKEFSAYREQVPKIQELDKAIADLEEESKKYAFMEFQEVFRGRKSVEMCLGGVCDLIDALSDANKKEFFQWFCEMMLEPYKRKFEEGTEEAKLEFMDHRYVWFRDAFKEIGDRYGNVFKAEWCMDELFSEEFCTLTKLSLINLLDKAETSINVSALVAALRRTTEFENALSDIFEPDDEIDEILAQQERDYARIKDPERRAYYIEQNRQKVESAMGIESGSGGNNGEDEPEIYIKPKKFKGIISSVFSRHMDVYVEQERTNVNDMFERTIKEEKWKIDDGDSGHGISSSKIFGSCTDLIYYMKTTMSRCMEISLDEPLLKVHEIIRNYLIEYAHALAKNFPSENCGSSGRVKEDALKMTCVIINTAEFCRTRCDQFQRTFKKKIITKLADKVSFKSASDEFKKACINFGMNLLTSLICHALDAPLNEMSKTNWSAISDVGDSSPYAYTISAIIESALPIVRNWLTDIPGLQTKHWQIFLDKFVTQFMRVHLDALYKCRKVGDLGVQVLLLDLASLRKLLLKLPLIGTPEGAAADVTQMDSVFYQSQNPGFSAAAGAAAPMSGQQTAAKKEAERWRKFVENTISAQNVVLKVTMSQQETMVVTYKTMMPKGSGEDFQKIIELKAGLSKLDKMALMDEYNDVPVGERSSILSMPQPNISLHALGETGAELKKKTKDVLGKFGVGSGNTSK